MKIFLDSIGCRLNQSEIEKMAAHFRALGHQVVDDPSGADWVIVNTCAVTAEAGSDSRQKIRQATRKGNAEVVVTGCWATLDPEWAKSLPQVSQVVPNSQKDNLVADLLAVEVPVLSETRKPLPGAHARTRAFIKVQDGCDNQCTFCITRLVRGKSRSVSLDDVLRDIRLALAGGAAEVVLSGVNLGSWGRDFLPQSDFKTLVKSVLRQLPTGRLRLSSLEPWDLDSDFFDMWSDARLCRHLHLPLQSGSESVLRRMGRKTSARDFGELVKECRWAVPEMAITTDIIVGFPGESAVDFEESLEFVRQVEFAAGHVFSFSPRPGTAAEKLGEFVSPVEIKRRNRIMRSALLESSRRYQAGFLGLDLSVLWETARETAPGGWLLEGWTDNYIRVTSVYSRNIWNELSRVRMTKLCESGLQGDIID